MTPGERRAMGSPMTKVPYTLSMDFVEETGNFCKALAEAINQREAAFGHFDVAHGHEWLPDMISRPA